MPAEKLRVVILKPSKYGLNGYVERFRRGFMPNSTVPYMRSMTPAELDGTPIETICIDEYVHTELDYLQLLSKPEGPTLLALVGVQSHQFHRSLDLAAFARANGVQHCVIGGPHPMTCDTSELQHRGVSFALAEAEMIWLQILRDAVRGELAPAYGGDNRWQTTLEAPVLIPPAPEDLRRYVVSMVGLYPARGCPFTCNFCSVIKIAGHRIRSQQIDTTMASLRAAKAAGVKMVMFTSDNFNKYPEAEELLRRMIEERIRLPLFVQCDTQVAQQKTLIELLGRAGCFMMFVGVESFNRQTLLAAHKAQNHPETYREIVRLCSANRIASHFSNIIGFPADTAAGIREHVSELQAIRPDCASFYILTPVPGTQQYDDYLRAGWINETNLDRFDGTNPTWRHPALAAAELRTLLFECYRRFYSIRQILYNIRTNIPMPEVAPSFFTMLGVQLFNRYAAERRYHPMAGGVGRVERDHVSQYLPLRRERFGCELVPLPQSLELSPQDAAFNQAGRAV